MNTVNFGTQVITDRLADGWLTSDHPAKCFFFGSGVLPQAQQVVLDLGHALRSGRHSGNGAGILGSDRGYLVFSEALALTRRCSSARAANSARAASPRASRIPQLLPMPSHSRDVRRWKVG